MATTSFGVKIVPTKVHKNAFCAKFGGKIRSEGDKSTILNIYNIKICSLKSPHKKMQLSSCFCRYIKSCSKLAIFRIYGKITKTWFFMIFKTTCFPYSTFLKLTIHSRYKGVLDLNKTDFKILVLCSVCALFCLKVSYFPYIWKNYKNMVFHDF